MLYSSWSAMKGAGSATAIVLFFAHAAFGDVPGGGVCKGKITSEETVEPVYLRQADSSVLKHVDGTYQVESGESVIVACPGSRKMFDTTLFIDIKLEDGTNSFLATCINGKMSPSILGVQRVIELGQWQCGTELATYFNKEKKSDRCKGTWVDSGFNANFLHGRILITEKIHGIESCYDERDKSVLYSKHIWSSGASLPHTTISWDSIFFDKTDLDNLYKKHSDLDRGHLAPDADFQNYALKKLTYYYHNAAPQWRTINTGAWRIMEDHIRKTYKSAEIYTGTSDGIMASGQAEYLNNTRKLVRIPDFFWKLVFPIDSNGNYGSTFGFVICNKKVCNRHVMAMLSNYPCETLEKGFCFYGDDGAKKMADYFTEIPFKFE